MCLPVLIFPCTIKSRSSLLALAHPGGPGKRAVKWLCVSACAVILISSDKVPAALMLAEVIDVARTAD